MKLATVTNEYHEGGNVSANNFRVANSPHIMDILSNKLYSNKIMAIVRELSVNALESHMMAGETKRFHVNLPTKANPTFTVRDFGTGMSLEKLTELYTVYGYSDKNESNELTGCLGIGSKSPFCYTDTFCVISYYNGKKICVVNTKDKRGVPNCVVMEVMDTTEPNGLEVYFDVQMMDISNFQYEAERIYRFFDEPNRPTCNIKLNTELPAAQFSGEDWKLCSGFRCGYAAMGQIGYKIDASRFNGSIRSLLNYGLLVNFEIGEVSMAASREHLEYNDHTQEALNTKLERIYKEVVYLITSSVNKCKNNFEAAIEARRIARDYSAFIDRLSDIKWNGKDITYSVAIPPVIQVRRFIGRQSSSRNTKGFVNKIDIDTNVLIYFADKIGAITACDKKAKEGNTVYLILSDESKQINEIRDLVGVDSIPAASTLPKDKYSRSKPKYYYTFLHAYYNNRITSYWDATDFDVDVESGVYVPIENNRLYGRTNPQQLYYFVKHLQGLNIPVPNIIGVKKSKLSLFDKSKNWESLENWVNTIIGLIEDDKYSFYVVNEDKLNFFNTELAKKIETHLKDIDRKSVFHKIFKMKPTAIEIKKYKKIGDINASYRALFGKDVKVQPSTDIIPDYEKLYPLVPHLRYVDAKLIVDYINLVERV